MIKCAMCGTNPASAGVLCLECSIASMSKKHVVDDPYEQFSKSKEYVRIQGLYSKDISISNNSALKKNYFGTPTVSNSSYDMRQTDYISPAPTYSAFRSPYANIPVYSNSSMK